MSTQTDIVLDMGQENSTGPKGRLRPVEKRMITVAVAGNPNSGKSTLINAIAGTRLHVGNWAGVPAALGPA